MDLLGAILGGWWGATEIGWLLAGVGVEAAVLRLLPEQERLDVVAQALVAQGGVLVAAVMWAQLAADEAAHYATSPRYGHACEIETSVGMAVAPQTVRPERIGPPGTAPGTARVTPVTPPRDPLGPEPLEPAVDRAGAAEEHGLDGVPGVALAQQEDDVGAEAEFRVGVLAVDRQQIAALLAEVSIGDQLAGRVVLQALIGRMVRMAQRDPRSSVDDYLALLWCVINNYPLQRRPVRIAANSSLACSTALSSVSPVRMSTPAAPTRCAATMS